MVQLIGTINEEATGAPIGLHLLPSQLLPVSHEALDGRVPKSVGPSESSRIFKPKSRKTVVPADAAAFETKLPFTSRSGLTEFEIDQLAEIEQLN